MHVHISSHKGEAKFWLEPVVALAEYYGLNKKEIKELHELVEKRKNEIEKSWKRHFKR